MRTLSPIGAFALVAFALSLGSCSTVAPTGYTLDPGIFAAVGVLVLAAVSYWVAYRQQTAEGSLNDTSRYLRRRMERLTTTYEQDLRQLPNRAEAHGLQLKGAGERIRKLEAELAGAQKTIDGMLKQRIDATKDEAARIAIKALSAKILGGTAVDSGLSVRGEITDMRDQVEGINTTLGNRMARLEKQDQAIYRTLAASAARRAVSDELIAREQQRRAERWWRRLSFWS